MHASSTICIIYFKLLLRLNPIAVQPLTLTKGFKFEASDGKGAAINILFVQGFVAKE